MNESNISKLIDDKIGQDANTSQFAVSANPFHVHNGSDTPRVAAQNLDFTNFATWGLVRLDGGVIVITNRNIIDTSVILLTTTIANTYALLGKCHRGFAEIAGGAGSEVVNYLIIF